MGFGVSNNVRSRVVRECTPELFRQVVRMPIVGQVCASIADAWESLKRGEMSKEDFEEFKSREKKRLPIFTFHATFKNGRRLNADAVPSGLSMYDIDHINDPRGYWERVLNEELRIKNEESHPDGNSSFHILHSSFLKHIVLVHVTPSGEGLRIVFRIPKGMDLAGAQRWMSEQLGDANYDQSVKDLARSSFAVPEDYILYINEKELFNPSPALINPSPLRGAPLKQGSYSEEQTQDTQKQVSLPDEKLPCLRGAGSRSETEGFETEGALFKGIPYSDIIKNWFALTGGEPVEGERNDRLHQLASHLRYITDNNEELLLQIMPRYGLSEEEMKGLIHSACQAKWCSIPRTLRVAIENGKLKMENSMNTPDGNFQLSIVNCPNCPSVSPSSLPC